MQLYWSVHQGETLAHPREQITNCLASTVVCPVSASSWAEYTVKHKKIKLYPPKYDQIIRDRKSVIRKSI